MRSKLTFFILLFAFWLALSAQTGPWLVSLGALSALLVLALSQHMGLIGSGQHSWRLYRKLPFYLLGLLRDIVISNLDVAARIVHPGLPIKPGFIRLPISRKNAVSRLIHANSITLTPGTITTYIDEDSIEVHD